MATNYNELLKELEAATAEAATAKAAATDSVEVKASRIASNLFAVLKTEGFPLDPSDAWFDQLDAIKALGPESFDRSSGDSVAARFAKLLALDPDDRPASFANVSEKAEAAVNGWNETAPTKRASRGSGGNSTPEGQLLSTVGLDRVDIDVTMPDGSVKSFHPASNWSNVSYTIAQVTKDLCGETYGAIDPTSRDAWHSARNAIKTGANMGPHSFPVNMGDVGTLTVIMTGVPLDNTAKAAA